MNNNYKLYIHKNKINCKVYIGITKIKNVNRRWQNGNGYKNNIHFYNAINKYGWDNFQHEILFDNLSEEEAELMEKCYIAIYDSTNPSKGYNNTTGGEVGKIYTEEARQKMSEAKKGKHHTEESKKKMSEARRGKNNSMYGKHHSEETREKMSKIKQNISKETRKKMSENHADVSGGKNPRAKKVMCLETGEVFDTVKQAYESVTGKGSISTFKRLMKNNEKYRGFTFVFCD